MSDQTVEARLAALEGRVHVLEDELAIHHLIVTYGFAVDAGDAESTGQLFAEEGVYDIDADRILAGRAGVRAMVLGPNHQSLLPNCAHTIGPAVVEVDGDRAVATAYSRIYRRRPRRRSRGDSALKSTASDAGRPGDPSAPRDAFELWRLSFNRFELERRENRWQIVRRTTRLLGHDEAPAILERALAGR